MGAFKYKVYKQHAVRGCLHHEADCTTWAASSCLTHGHVMSSLAAKLYQLWCMKLHFYQSMRP